MAGYISNTNMKMWQTVLVSLVISFSVAAATLLMIRKNMTIDNTFKYLKEDLLRKSRMKNGHFKPKDILGLHKKTVKGKRLSKTELAGYENWKSMLKEGSVKALELQEFLIDNLKEYLKESENKAPATGPKL
jgi:hypothetical protein